MNPRAKNFSCANSLVASLALTATTFLAQAQQADTKALFDQVSNRLDLGGQVFGFVNVQGDYASLAAKAKELYGQVIKMADDEIPLPEDLDIEAILKELGFSNVSALGMSSIKVGDGFRNKAFLGINGEPQGLLKIASGKNKPFSIITEAPEDASFAFEGSLRLDYLRDVINKIAAHLAPAIGGDPVSEGLKMPVPMTQLTINELIEKLSGDVSGYATMSKIQKLEIPGAPNGFEIPAIDFVAIHESGRWLFTLAEELLSALAPDMIAVSEGDDGSKRLVVTLPPGKTGFYKPVLQVAKEGDRLVIASRELALQNMGKTKKHLADNTTFKAITKDMPKEGSGLIYMSEDSYKAFIDIYVSILSMEGGPEEVINMQKNLMEAAYGKPQAVASVFVNHPDGIYLETMQPQSYKQTIAVMAVVPAAIGAAVMTPMMMRARF